MAGTLAVGRPAPRLKVSFYAVCIDGSNAVQLGGRDYNPDTVSFQATTKTNCGYETATITYDLQPYSADPATLLHHAEFEQREEMRYFTHVVVTDNGQIVWEGRISALYTPGGRFQKFDALGYGQFALQDYPIVWTDATTSYTSGQVLRDALHSAAPIIRIGVQNAGSPQTWAEGVQYVDPGVPHTRADIANVKYPLEVLNQIVAEGNLQGGAVWYGVYEHRTMHLLPVGSGVIDYAIDWDQAVEYKADASNMYGAVLLAYSGSATGKTSITWPEDVAGQPANADWVQTYGLSINGRPRTAHINGGTLTDARALAVAQTQAGILSQPTITAKVTIGGPVTEGEVSGIRMATGGTRGPHLVRAGENVTIGTGRGSVTVPIARTTFTVDGATAVNVLELGQPYPDLETRIYNLRQSAYHYGLGTLPATGANAV